MPACAICGENVDATARFCPRCGTARPQPPIVPPPLSAPAAYPAPPAYPYYVPPPKPNHTALIVVLVVVLVIAVPVVFAAVLYIMVSGLIMPVPGPGFSKPVVTFATPLAVPDGEQLTVAAASSARTPSDFKINLRVDADIGTAVNAPMGSGAFYRVYTMVGYDGYAIEWTDIGGEGTVSSGDQFTVTIANGTWPGGATMTFYLLWSDGSVIASVSWISSASRPVVAFSTPTPSGSGEALPVASASQALSPSNYMVNVASGNLTGIAAAMPTTSGGYTVLAVGSDFYRVNWTDVGGEATLNGGDVFTIARTDSSGTTFLPMPAGTLFTFYLLWSDGSFISSVIWTTP